MQERGEGRAVARVGRGRWVQPLPLLIMAAACRHCCQFGRVFDSGPQVRASEQKREGEREGARGCGLAALWGVRGHSNCSRIIIFMAIVISELIAAAATHTHIHTETARWRHSA